MDGGAFAEPGLFGENMPPCNIELEMALLGAVLVDHRVWDRVIEAVPGFGQEAFYDESHRLIVDAIERMAARGERVDMRMLAHSLGGEMKEYLAELAAGAMNTFDAPAYAKSLEDLALARELAPVLTEAAQQVAFTGGDKTARDQIADLEGELFALAERVQGGAHTETLTAVTERALRRAQEASRGNGMIGIATGIRAVDEATGGLAAPDLIIIAGRPGMGKTTFARRIAFNIARQGLPVGVFSLEMSSEQLATAELANAAGVPLKSVRRGTLDAGDWNRLMEAQASIGGLPIFIDDTPAITPAAMRARARRMKRRHGLGLVVVDYLQLMNAGIRGGNRNDEITVISQSLKALAKDLGIPVIALSQLSRGVEQREDKRPMLSDLRDSGSIEQDADMVWMLYRPAYYHRDPIKRDKESDQDFSARLLQHTEQARAEANLLELNIAKFRQGETQTIRLFADMATSRFGDFQQHTPEAPF